MKKRIIALGAVILIVIVGWSGGWLFLSDQIKRNVAAMAEADGVAAPKVTCGTLTVGGFPFRFDLDCADGTLVSGDVTATLAELRVSVRVYDFYHARISARGPVMLTDAFTGSQSKIEWETLEASARITNNRIGRISIEATKPVWTDMIFGDLVIASADKIETHLLDIPERHEADKGLAALASYSKVSNAAMPALTLNAAEIELQGNIIGLPADVASLGAPDALQRWQQAGGKLQDIALNGTDGERFARAEGTLGLDDQGRMEGQVNLTSRGAADILFAAVPEQLKGAVIGPVGADGSTHQVMNFRAGVMVVGVLPLMMTAPLY